MLNRFSKTAIFSPNPAFNYENCGKYNWTHIKQVTIHILSSPSPLPTLEKISLSTILNSTYHIMNNYQELCKISISCNYQILVLETFKYTGHAVDLYLHNKIYCSLYMQIKKQIICDWLCFMSGLRAGVIYWYNWNKAW